MKILSQMNLWTRKFQLNFRSHRDPEFGSCYTRGSYLSAVEVQHDKALYKFTLLYFHRTTVARYGHAAGLFFTPRAHVNHIARRVLHAHRSSTCERR